MREIRTYTCWQITENEICIVHFGWNHFDSMEFAEDWIRINGLNDPKYGIVEVKKTFYK